MALAFVCPGQGAQNIGMGKEFADQFNVSKQVFEEVDDALGEPLSRLIWEGELEALTLTENTQPALMATSLAAARAMESEGYGVELAHYVAGHSLGEYSALAIAGAFSVGDAAKLLRTRGKAMQAAVPVGEGAMAALIGLDFKTATNIAKEAAGNEVCEAANDNDPTQVVISGNKLAVNRAVALAKVNGAKRAVLLPVSAPFHCSLMSPAIGAMRDALSKVAIHTPKVPVVSNVLAKPSSNPDEIRKLLIAQITGSVRWRESVLWMASNGVSEIWEIGAGKALNAMIKRINRDMICKNIASPKDIIELSQ